MNRFGFLLLACLGGAPGSLVGQQGDAPASIDLHGSASALAHLFDSLGYQLDSVAVSKEAPRVFVATLPGDMASMSPVQAKVDLFIRLLLPLALEANERIAAQRDSLLALQKKSGKWSNDIRFHEVHWFIGCGDAAVKRCRCERTRRDRVNSDSAELDLRSRC